LPIKRFVRLIRLFSFVIAASFGMEAANSDVTSASEGTRSVVFSEESELFLAIEFSDGLVVRDSISAYESDRGVLIPFREFFDAIGISLEIDTARGQASGFIIREENTFSLSLSPCRLKTASGEMPLDCSAMVLREDDIFLPLSQLQTLLPATITLDRYSAKIFIDPTEPFPPQARARRAREGDSPAAGAESVYGDVYLGERRDLSLSGMSYSLSGTGGLSIPSRTSGEISLVGGVVGLESRFRYSTASDGAGASQFALSEYSDDSTLELVDFVAPPVPLIGSLGVLRGAHYANQSDESAIDSLSWIIDGVAPDGWDVELTQNGQLIQRSRVVDGRYLFQRVKLQTGINRFMVILLGPQGQRRTEFRSIDVEPNLATVQKFRYRLISGADDTGRWSHLAAGLLRGGTNWGIRLLGGEISLPREAETRPFLGGGLLWFGSGLSSTIQVATQPEGRWGSEWVVRRPFDGGLIAFTRQELRGFSSYQFRADQGQTLNARSSLSGFFQSKVGINLFNDLELSQNEYQDGVPDSELRWRLSTQIFRTNLLYDFRYNKNSEVSNQGQLSASIPAKWGDARIVLVHESPRNSVSQIQGQFTTRQGAFSGLQSGLNYSIVQRSIDSSIDYRWTAAEHDFSVGTSWRSANNEAVFRVSLSSSLDFFQVPQQLPQITRFDRGDFVTAKISVNNDADGSPFEGAEILMNGQRTGQRTDSQGVAILRDVPRRQTSRISIRTDDLEDPYLQPQPSAWRIRGTTGRASDMVFRMKNVGEVSGFVRSTKPAKRLGGIRVILVDEKGKEVATLRTSSDGYFYFGSVDTGRYQVQLSAEDLLTRDLVLKNSTMIEVVIDPKGEMSSETLIEVL